MDVYKYIDVSAVRVSARPGSAVGDCIREGIMLASREWRNVELIHDGKIYRINANDLFGCATEISQDA